ncbi:HDOD domain-containing protein [Aquabacterium sp. A08]|uniref:HDOD domain-containing protein n=1 Tax=Aquabacterium sp. A08 TaxID=2718532 RepID=UPI001421116F|nr:HDOD domain-containing protein [Aquabacterium sp. A08]NIC40552.1 HDOD domain-containing protein [Aquabacterium sp. A08]
MRLTELLRQPQALPVVPEVAAKLIATFHQDDVDLQAVNRDVERDPALAARLLRQANSSFFRLARPVHSVRDAVAVLGLNKVRALVIGASMQDSFRAVVGVDLDDFWHYSFAAATVARLICAPRRLDENVAFTAGLLHGVGELVMHMGMVETMQPIDRDTPLLALHRAGAEYRALGYSYAEAGAALARHWHLPPLLVTAIEQHGAPLAHDPLEPLAAVVHMAAWRARVLVNGNRADDLIHTYPDAVGEILGLDPDWLVAPNVAGLDQLSVV